MFQNIAEEEKLQKETLDVEEERTNNTKGVLKRLFTKQNILVYIISFMLSIVSTAGGMAPFGLAIFAAVLSNGLPGAIVFAVTLIRNYYTEWDLAEL